MYKKYIDPLTNLHNLRYLKIGHLNGHGVLFIDLTGFKKINDSIGHEAGDDILKMVSKILTENVKGEHDRIIRRSGDEFVIAIKFDKDSDEDKMKILELIKERINKAFKEHKTGIHIKGNETEIKAKIGIAIGEQIMETVDSADIEMCKEREQESLFGKIMDFFKKT